MKPEHYLLTVDLANVPSRLHSYLMTDDKAMIIATINKMFDIIEQQGLGVALPIVLQTQLQDAAKVRAVISRDPDCRERLATTTTFHCSIFTLPCDDPDDAMLMDLH